MGILGGKIFKCEILLSILKKKILLSFYLLSRSLIYLFLNWLRLKSLCKKKVGSFGRNILDPCLSLKSNFFVYFIDFTYEMKKHFILCFRFQTHYSPHLPSPIGWSTVRTPSLSLSLSCEGHPLRLKMIFSLSLSLSAIEGPVSWSKLARLRQFWWIRPKPFMQTQSQRGFACSGKG